MAWKPANLEAMVNALLRHISTEDLRDALGDMGIKERHEAEERFINIRGKDASEKALEGHSKNAKGDAKASRARRDKR